MASAQEYRNMSEKDLNVELLNLRREQFSLRIPENLAKIERIKNIYNDSGDIPKVLFEELEAQRQRLLEAQKQFGDRVSPESFKEVAHAG